MMFGLIAGLSMKQEMDLLYSLNRQKWKFNYVNDWSLQKEGPYKLEMDTYNRLK
jgi:hypothetical protein